MSHQWGEYPCRFQRKRQCERCGLVQTYSSGIRRLTYEASGGWFPSVGRCGCVNLRLRRLHAGGYETADGLFAVWKEADANRQYGCPSRWFVNHKDYDETLTPSGFETKWQAVEWLRENAAKYLTIT